MKLFNRIRGPRLFTKLLLVGVLLLLLPWLAYLQIQEMEKLLVQGQQNAQLLMARGVSSLFFDRIELFDELPVGDENVEPLYVNPIHNAMRVDGLDSDWSPDISATTWPRTPVASEQNDSSFHLRLGERVERLYAFLSVRDDHRVYHTPGSLDLTRSDRVVIHTGTQTRYDEYVISFSNAGIASVFHTRDATGGSRFTSSAEFFGYVEEIPEGFAIEFSLPINLLDLDGSFLLQYIDVDGAETAIGQRVVSTAPVNPSRSTQLVIFRSSNTMNLINSLGYIDAHVVLYDDAKRIRGESRPIQSATSSPTQSPILSWLQPIVRVLGIDTVWIDITHEDSEKLAQSAIDEALLGVPSAIKRITDTGRQSIMAVQPIRNNESVIGVVTVEQNIEEILSFQNAALQQIVLVTFVALVILIVILGAFSARLAYRISKLKEETSEILDQGGRLTRTPFAAEVTAGDEIGDLARAIGDMVSRIQDHHRFVERMPRTLRHEINNPLNNLSTSLQNLENARTKNSRTQYLESARRGLFRIANIVQSLSEAASLEEALLAESKTQIDVNNLLAGYIRNQTETNTGLRIEYQCDASEVNAHVSDTHIEQMMDKMLENALDFHRKDSPITVALTSSDSHIRIIVANRGPTIQGDPNELFELLVSQRTEGDRVSDGHSHFGLGLFVVRTIAEFHHGTAKAFNLPDNSGVVIAVEIPRRFDTPTDTQRLVDNEAEVSS